MKINSAKNSQKGFTLIELLVVVAIIGVLASVVLAVTSSARVKGADAAVKANLATVRSQSEIFYNENNNSFLVSGGTFVIAACPAYNASGTNMVSRDKNIASAIAEATNRGGYINSCYNSSSAWAVAVGLKSTSGTTSWCIDSAGAAKTVAAAANAAINVGSFVCN